METTPYLFADKPDGIPTHSPDGEQEGFVEYLKRQLGFPLWICHRLDKATSGALVFGRSAPAAAVLSDLFASRLVEKVYRMLTDRDALKEETEICTDIKRRGNRWHSSNPHATGNARTHFKRLSHSDGRVLWEVRPLTGKPHQIRLHAQQLGIPILGDREHGGTPCPRLMLHACGLNFSVGGKPFSHWSPAPALMTDLQLLDDADLALWLAALDRRQRLFPSAGDNDAFRIVHNDGAGMRCDRYGQVCWIYWYRSERPRPKDRQRFTKLTAAAGARHWRVRIMRSHFDDIGEAPTPHTDAPDSWKIQEHGLCYQCRADRGLSPGLFLDQRSNRLWVKRQANRKRVLNLFCYTSGFGLSAADGGALQIVNVDSSRTNLDWSRENFRLNDLDSDKVEYWTADARSFLHGCRRRGRRFDLIICDPPSFSRGRDGLFRIERDLPELVPHIVALLTAGGVALLCTNYEQWTWKQFRNSVRLCVGPEPLLESAPIGDWDFEMPNDRALMKSLLLTVPS